MPSDRQWSIRVENNTLYIDDTKSGNVVLQHNARPGLRPYIHPLRGPDGKTCLTEDSPWHHPWQHGLSTGFHGVNECDFWFDTGQKAGMAIGNIDTSLPRTVTGDRPRWAVEAMWRNVEGCFLLFEQQTWSMDRDDEVVLLDLEWRLQAIPDVRIEKMPYGGLFLRMPFRIGGESTVINSEGAKDDDCEQRRAAWVDLHMAIERSAEGGGITILDHPSNPGHPAYWRVDGNRGINPSPCIPGPIELKSGESMRNLYRAILHTSPLASERIDRCFVEYSQ